MIPGSDSDHPSFRRSFGFALQGFRMAIKTERNIRVMLAGAALAAILGILCQIDALSWAILALCCGVVLCAELVNTALETIVDLVSPEFHPLAGRAKDIAAAAVYVLCCFVAVCGIIIFARALLDRLSSTLCNAFLVRWLMSDQNAKFTSGFVALVGRPNVGKSTLLNACLGHRVAITSPVAQTTRKRMRGVITTEDSQIIIVDTPGLHKPKDALGKELNRAALGELQDVDVIAFLIDATKPVGRGDEWVAKHVASAHAHKILVITKADLASEAQVQAQLEASLKLAKFDDTIVLSAQENFNVDAFLKLVAAQLPEGPQWFPEDMDTDASDEELVAEFIREKVLYHLKQEIPHSVGVLCDDISWPKKDHASITATILVERLGQKRIVIGHKGSMIKQIGIEARKDLEKLFGTSVYLSLEVRVRPSWRRDANEIRRLGYDAGE